MSIENFQFKASSISVAADDCWDLSDDLRFLIQAYHDAYEFVSRTNEKTIFYQYKLCYGKTSGFQILINSELELENFISDCLLQWKTEKTIPTVLGESGDLNTLLCFPVVPKNLNKTILRRAVKREYKLMYNQLVDFANSVGLGEVTETGSVNYFSNLRKFSARRQASLPCI